MIDYLFAAPTEADAIASPALAAFRTPDAAWRLDVVNPGLRVWSGSDDMPLTLPGFWLTISQNARNAALEASPLLILGADRDAASLGLPRGSFVIALGPGQTLSRFADMHVSPLMAGSNYPFGAFQ